jgi:hypothetical protein
MDLDLIALGGFFLALVPIGVAAERFGVESRHRDDRSNW